MPYRPLANPKAPARRCGRLAVPLLTAALISGCAAGPGPESDAAWMVDPLAPVLERMPASDRDRAIQHVLAAEIAVRRERYGLALEHYAEAMQLTGDPQVAERSVQLAIALDDAERAEAAARRWKELAPEQAEAHQLLGLLALRRGDVDTAEAELLRAIEGWPGPVGQGVAQVSALLRHGVDSGVAFSVAEGLAKAHPEVAEAHRGLARAAAAAERPERALEAARRAFELDPVSRQGAALLVELIWEGVREEQLDPESAIGPLAEVREHQPAMAERVAFLEGYVLQRANRLEEAVEAYDRGLESAPDDSDLLYGRGLAHAELGHAERAEADLRRVLELDPENPYALNALGYTLADFDRDLEEAQGLIARALEQKPENAAILDSKGWVLYRQGDLRAAHDYLERAYQTEPDAEIGAHLGEVLWELGKQDKAREIWADAWGRDPEHRVLKETLERYEIDPETL